MPYLHAADLTYRQLGTLDMSRTICFQAVSALEVHGPHLPLGMDYFMATWMAEESGRRFADSHPDWTVVQLPPLPLGTDELPLAGSMNASQRTVYGALMAHGRSLVRAGYRYIVLTNGHGGPRHAAALEYACHRISKRYGVHMIVPANPAMYRIVTGQCMDLVESLLGRALTDAERTGALNGEHAGTWETSFMLAENPALVDPCYRDLPLGGPPAWKPLARLGERLAQRWRHRGRDAAKLEETFKHLAGGAGWLLNATYGYGGPTVTYQGDPSVASAELGHVFREVMVRECLAIVEKVAAGETRPAEVRTIASDHVFIQPRFLPRLGWTAAAVLALMLL